MEIDKLKHKLIMEMAQARLGEIMANSNHNKKDAAYYRGVVAGMKTVITMVFGDENAKRIAIESRNPGS